jgi:hypothetical protein
MGAELLGVMDKVLTSQKVMEDPEEEPIEGKLAQTTLGQARRVSYMALEVCDDTTKADWEAFSYSRYRWQLNQEAA